ncbi:MAG: hypothetical protein KF730_05240 [Sphingomonas sp.]|uniref:hypothetical protein n=1 Tax=Sphingomonas sp. TaxID=28214 RepID=UPI0025F60F32|nr:hypothetical protein [Sphingomonas sp.]MBX3563967.1 hypothetical protein [Sphingomonas sp.]
MGIFERLFRSKFMPADGGYLYRVQEVDYWFDAERIEQFVAKWRQHWNPIALAMYLLLGVALPAYLYFQEYWGMAFVIGTIAGIVMAVNLIHPLREPVEATRDMFGYEKQRPFVATTGADVIIAFAGFLVIVVGAWFLQRPGTPWFDSSNMLVIFWVINLGCASGLEFVLWWRERRGTVWPLAAGEKYRVQLRGFYVVLPVLAIMVWLSPASGWLDRAFPLMMLGILIAIDVWGWLKKRIEKQAAP